MGKTQDLFKKNRERKGTFTPRIEKVENKQGNDLSEEAEVKAKRIHRRVI